MADILPTWNLGHFFASNSDPALMAAIEGIIPAAAEFESLFRGRLANLDAAGFAQALAAYERASLAPMAPYAYAHLRFAQDSMDPGNVALIESIRQKANDAHRLTLFFNTEPDAMDDSRYSALANHSLLAPWAHYLTHARLQKRFRLSEKEESIIALKALTGRMALVQLYSRLTSAMRFPSPVEEGVLLTNAEILAFQKHPEREVRRRAMEIFSAEYEKEKLVISTVWNALALDHGKEIQLRGYTHPMEPTNIGNELSPASVSALMEVSRKNYGLAARYYRWKARTMGVDRLFSTDLVAPLGGVEAAVIPFETAKGWVLEAFDDFSPGFGAIAKGFFDEGRVDAAPRQGKSGGAFCMAVAPQLPVYVLMNYTGKMRDAATLAHELGHGIHFTMARKQPLLEYDPVLPMAETASVFGELLLTRRMLGQDLDPLARRNLLAERVEDIIATTFRQAMYTDFELACHLNIAQGTMAEEEFCELWHSHLQGLYGDSVEILPGSRWTWAAIPHFIHTRFYCYAYTFGELFVLSLYGRYKEEGRAFVPKFVKLLEAGGSRPPSILAAQVGLNLEDPSFWQGGYDVLEELIGELEKS